MIDGISELNGTLEGAVEDTKELHVQTEKVVVMFGEFSEFGPGADPDDLIKSFFLLLVDLKNTLTHEVLSPPTSVAASSDLEATKLV